MEDFGMYLKDGTKLNLPFEERLHYAADNPDAILGRKSQKERKKGKVLIKKVNG